MPSLLLSLPVNGLLLDAFTFSLGFKNSVAADLRAALAVVSLAVPSDFFK